MYTDAEITAAIEELESCNKHTIQNVAKLAALYTVRNNMQGSELPLFGYSKDTEQKEDCVGLYGDTEFLRKIHGKDCKEAWLIMNDAMDCVNMLNPRLYNNIMNKLE